MPDTTSHRVTSKAAGRGRTQHAMLQRYFMGLEVVEAKNDLRIQPNDEDVRTAITGDPTHCALSRACQRMWSSSVALFFETVAYVDLLDEKGGRRVERFHVPPQARAWIEAFDRGEPIDPAGFLLKAPPPGSTLDAEAKRSRERHQAVLKGTATRNHGASSGPRKEGWTWTGRRSTFYRSGKGMVHFRKSADGREESPEE